MKHTLRWIATGFVAALIATATAQAQSWTTVASLATPRGALTATLLDNGKVLITGGTQQGVTDYLASCELFDPVTLTVAPAPSMVQARTHHQAVKLMNGKVLVVGGWGPGGTGSGSYLRSCELYDPVANTWAPAGSMKTAASDHRLALLDNGQVLRVCGPTMNGFGTTTCEIYDPTTDTWSYTGSTAVGGHSRACAKLADGRVLTAGGYMFNNDVEVYNPGSGAWAVVGTLQHRVGENRALQLNDGKVFIMGGVYWSGIHYYYPSVDVYDPLTGLVAPGPNMVTARANFEAVKLAGGDLLVMGGTTGNGVNATATACERYSAAAGVWQPAPALNESRAYFEAIQTRGKVFVFGGFSNQPGGTKGVSTVEMLPMVPATACEQIAQLAEQIEAVGLVKNTRPLMASLEAACASFERGNSIAAVNQLEAFQRKVLAQVAKQDPVSAEKWIQAAQEIIDQGQPPKETGPRLVVGDVGGNVSLVSLQSGATLGAVNLHATAIARLDVMDVDGNAQPEVLATHHNGVNTPTTCLNLPGLSLKWQTDRNTSFGMIGGELIGAGRVWGGDFARDGELKLLIPSVDPGGVMINQIFRAADGKFESALPNGLNWYPVPFEDPLDGHWKLTTEIAPNAFTHYLCVYDLTQGRFLWTNKTVNTWLLGSVGASLVDGTPRLWGGWYGRTLYVTDRNGVNQWKKSFGGSYEAAGVYAGDLLGNGTDVVLVAGTYGSSRIQIDAARLADGAILWTFSDAQAYWSSHVLGMGDADADGDNEVIIWSNGSSSYGKLPKYQALNGKDGTRLWQQSYSYDTAMLQHARLVDVNGDGRKEVLLAVNNTIEARDVVTGALVKTYSFSANVTAFETVGLAPSPKAIPSTTHPETRRPSPPTGLRIIGVGE